MKTLFLRYFMLINLVTFIIRGVDKYKAKKQLRRIPEKTLLMCTGMGGWIGALAGVSLFRHKTIKGKFLIRLYSIIGIWIILCFWLLFSQ